MLLKRTLSFLLAAIFTPALLSAADKPVTPPAAEGDAEAERAIAGFQLPKGFKCELIAGDAMLANPVAFTMDERGRFYVAETFRLNAGVPDIRRRMSWLDTELASKSVAERIAYTRRLEPGNDAWWTNRTDRISLLWDTNGDGRLDQSKIFADHFNDLADGIGSGVLARNGDVYYANIPHLWLLRDTNRDGVADVRKSLSYGYGVRYGFVGHDLHGLIIGPDGRLYFSIGDRGAHLDQPRGKDLDNSESGAVFRCELDGSNVEIVYTGLRNPQELTFDDVGNLWTCDNNSDACDPARVVYLAEGGDSGWRIGWQFIDRPIARSSWLGERLCYEAFPDRAVYALPPISSKVGNGPSGLAYDPGTSLPPQWRGKFFLVNFSGQRSSGIYAFNVKPRGAGFELDQNEKFWWKFLPTDVAFGYDGCIYASDWIDGWNGQGKGRIYRIFQPDERNRPVINETKKLMAEGFGQRSNVELVKLLSHADRRIRQEAQFALVAHDARPELSQAAAAAPTLFGRLHAVWGLGQLERNGKRGDFEKLLADAQPEVRAQAAHVVGDARAQRFAKSLVRMLADSEPRPRYFAALALGKLGYKKSVPEVAAMLRAGGEDPWLRHAGVMAFVGGASEKELAAMTTDASVDLRLAAVVALRRLASPKLDKFLADSDPRVVAEAARAINDLPVASALPALASLADQRTRFTSLPAGTDELPTPRDAILRRVVNANFRIGTAPAISRLAALAADEAIPESIRREAITTFEHWQKPDGKDIVSGLWRPLDNRAPVDFAKIEPAAKQVLAGPAAPEIKAALLTTAGNLGWRSLDAPAITLWQSAPATKVQVATLEFFGAINSARLADILTVAGDSKFEEVRIAALKLAVKFLNGERLTAVLEKVAAAGTLRERQNVYQIIGASQDPGAVRLLANRLDDLIAGKVPADLRVDLLEAAAKHREPQITAKLAAFQNARAGKSGVDQFSECLNGGDADNGKKIFREKVEASCMRCHKINGEGGEAAPDLTKIGARLDRAYLLESITYPNAKIAAGFENIQVVRLNGISHVGIVKSDTPDELALLTPDDGLVKIKKADIKSRAQAASGMLDNFREILTKREIRDLVEYLATLK